MNGEIEYWAILFAEAREENNFLLSPEDLMAEHLEAACEFINACPAAGEKPTIGILVRMAAEPGVLP